MMQQEIRNQTGGEKKVCAVIVSYNSPESVMTCIDSLEGQADKIVVVDNSADSQVKDILCALPHADKIAFIFNETNVGLGAALNQGLQYSVNANYRWTLLLDQDSILAENMVFEMIRSYEYLDDETKESTAMVVPAVFDKNFKKMLPSVITTNFLNKKIGRPSNDCFVHFHVTSGSLLKNALVSRAGLMNENLFIDYIDFDYCFRILDRNLRILLSKNALLYHSLAETKQKLFFHYREHQPIRIYYQTRNSLYTLFKYGKKYRSFLYFEIFRLIRRPVKTMLWESQKIQKLRMYFRAIRDFIRGYRKLDID
jgi:rhamnosyltransferase